MKLKNVYLSILTFAALTACTSEEIIIDKPGPNAQAVPSVLVLGADMSGTPVETKTEDGGTGVVKDKGTGLLYALVFDAANGQLLGAAKSASGEKNKETMDEVIAKINESNVFVDFDNPGQISGERLTFDENEVVVTGLSFKEPKKVTVVLVANPVEEPRETILDGIVDNAKNNKEYLPILDNYSKDRWALALQNTVLAGLENRAEGYSLLTASQCFSMTLEPGINYIGKKNSTVEGDWFTHANIEIPLYRLVADVNLTIVNQIIGGGSFTVNKVLPGEYYYSSCVPTSPVDFDNIEDSYISSDSQLNEDGKANEGYYSYWCKLIDNVVSPEVPWNAFPDESKEIGNGNSYSFSYCTFEANNKLQIKGTYNKGGIEKEVTYTYTFNTNETNQIRRNKVYNVTLTLTQEPELDGELIPLGVGLMLEIADMAKIDYNVSFGD